MGRDKLPIEIVKARGAKHLSKAEIAERTAREIKPIADNIEAPAYLTKKQKNEFYRIADQLKRLKIMGETDADALARYIIANDFYINTVKQMRKKEILSDPILFESWAKIQNKYFKQCQESARDLGLTISSRCKLVVPETGDDTPKENKFRKFEKRAIG